MSERNIIDRIFESRRLEEASVDYKNADDEELVPLANKGDRRAQDEILRRYEKLVRHIAKGFFMPGGDQEDLTQEGLLGLYAAMKDYVPGKNKNFQQFAMLAAKRNIMDAVRSANTQKNSFINKATDIDTVASAHNKETSPTANKADSFSAAVSKRDPEAVYIQKADKDRLLDYMKKNLTDWQHKVLSYYLQGYNYDEIAKKTGKDNKAINNAMNMVRSKLRGYKQLYKESTLIESILASIESNNKERMLESYSILYSSER